MNDSTSALSSFGTLAGAYVDGLSQILQRGARVASVTDPLSKASNFGTTSRPSLELIAHRFVVSDPRCLIVTSDVLPIRLPYCFGLLAWTLRGRNDVATLSYYRAGAIDYSDDGYSLSGAFGRRLFGDSNARNQLSAIVRRIRDDPTSRRTYATIIDSEDNLTPSREYPCASGVQLFVREGRLSLMTVMRAQQALTVLPYDAFLFMSLQLLLANHLEAGLGDYIHFAGTYHIYSSEADLARSVVAGVPKSVAVPFSPWDEDPVDTMEGLCKVEEDVRSAALRGRVSKIDGVAQTDSSSALVKFAQYVLCNHAYFKCGVRQEMPAPAFLPRSVAQAASNPLMHEC